ncbi:motility protein A [Desulfoplanes formicivorans]|uniref:Flagellar motor protein MotA n=1 Tax=Desulfoplanes formicivorans TaxID=1592317 RepID=A0A194AGL2_9BACT|nr:MotA/TolQ/ExbB proton channel family protein [Desulfoplanes formicivorans]GAU08468.1 flagellar motor protein MotA [Desulfoplanes formicivorans]
MTRKNFYGAAVCLCIFLMAFVFMDNGLAFLNLSGLAVVVCGTLGAIFLSHPYDALIRAFKTCKHIYTTTPPPPASIVQSLLELSIKSRCHGLLSLEKSAGKHGVAFLRNGLELLVDGYSQEEIREILSMEMVFFKNRRQQSEVIFRNMGRIAPSFGVAGSVIGLIGMLSGLGDTEIILQTIPMALTSTLYGIVFNQFFCTPLAESVRGRTNDELLNASIILEGVLAIRKEQHPRKLEKRLASFLAPAERYATTRDFQAIRQKYIRMVRTRHQEETADLSGPSAVTSLHTVPTRS